MAALSLGTRYITRVELAGLQPELKLADFSDDEQDNLISLVSRAVDAYVGSSFGAQVYEARHSWDRDSRRTYLDHWPVIEIARYRLYFSPAQYADVVASDIFVVDRERFIEVSSSTLIVASLASPMIHLGIAVPSAEVTYAAGHGSFADSTATLDEDLDAADLEITVSDEKPFAVGDVIKIDSEWLVVVSTAAKKVTVTERGAHRTTAAAHTTGAVIYLLTSDVPNDVKVATALTAAAFVNDQLLQGEGLGNLKQATIGSYSITIAGTGGVGDILIPAQAQIILDRYRHISLA